MNHERRATGCWVDATHAFGSFEIWHWGPELFFSVETSVELVISPSLTNYFDQAFLTVDN